MDAGAALGLAIIPPCVAIFFEAVNPLRHRYVESSVERDLEKFRKVAQGAAGSPNSATLDDTAHSELVQKVVGATKATIEVAMLSLTVVSAITSGFAVLHELQQPYWPTIGYVIFFIVVALITWRLLAGYTLYEIDEKACQTFRLSGRTHSFSRSQVITIIIYLLNGLLIIFAFVVLEVPDSWKAFFKY